MKFHVTAPHEMETREVKVEEDERGLEIQPLTVKNKHVLNKQSKIGNA